MNIRFKNMQRFSIAGLALAALGQLAACTTDDGDAGSQSGGTAGTSNGTAGTTGTGGDSSATGSGGTTSTAGTGGTSTTSSTVCAVPLVLPATAPSITDFENYDGTDLSTWSFALGDDSSTGIFSGTFGYGDEPDGTAETFTMAEGHDSVYGLSVADSLSDQYGGGMGLWISECLDARAFSGVSFWVRGNAPTGDAKFSLLMEATTPDTNSDPEAKLGTCAGTTDTCVHPSVVFPVTDDWTEVRTDWGDFVSGNAVGTLVPPDGNKIWQVQFDIGLVWVTDDEGVATPTPAEYELDVDDMTFY